jgi:SAM-dependent methyltransferase
MAEDVRPADHWNEVYAAPSDRLGWYEAEPSTLALVTANSSPQHAVIDVGGGDSRLVDHLLELGYDDLTVLDLSAVALARAQRRLGPLARRVTWHQADVTTFPPDRRWDVWHDRAVFHFLVDAGQRDAYRRVLGDALEPGGVLVIAAFGLSGPPQCAGLPVARYDMTSLAAEFSVDFDVISVGDLAPARTDDGDQRPYVAGAFARRASADASHRRS